MDLSDLAASRLLFGLTAAFHFLFVPLTIGLATLMALLEGLALWTGRGAYRELARFCTWPFLLHFVCGVLTGYPLRHQLATNWSVFASAVAPVFEHVFSFEGNVAPVMLTLVAVVTFGWRLKPVWHWLATTALAGVLMLQSTGILMLNAWMQNPVGARIVDGRIRVDDMALLLHNPLLAPKVLHTLGGAWVLGGMVLVAVTAAWRLRGGHGDVARRGLRVSAWFTFASLMVTGIAGHWSGERLVTHQPMKFAAIEALWDIGPSGPDLVLFALPDARTQSNRYALTIDGGLAQVVADPDALVGLRDLASTTPGGALPDVPLVFWSFRTMLGCWGVMMLLVAAVCLREPDPSRPFSRFILNACRFAWPLPWIATEAGWLVCEAGRQPWAVTGLLSTRASLGGVTSADVMAHLQVAVPMAVLMLVVNAAAMAVHVRRGPGVATWPVPQGRRRGGALGET